MSDSPLQIVMLMAVWHTSNLKKVCQTAIRICRGLSHPTKSPAELFADGRRALTAVKALSGLLKPMSPQDTGRQL
jgi:hypothetical protein